MNIEQVARIAHETNRAYCESIGDMSQKPWLEAEQWQRDSAVKGVEYKLANPNAQPSAQHEAWLMDKVEAGWVYGPIKDASKKEHPCMVNYDQLPEEQRLKDSLFVAIVEAFTRMQTTQEKATA